MALYIVLAILIIVFATLAFGVYKVLALDNVAYREYWQKRRTEPVGPDDIRLIALGDSTIQGLGASSPLKGTVGRVAELIEYETGRKVHIDNVSVTGAKAHEVVSDQLVRIDAVSADIIIVAVGANDASRKSDIEIFRHSINAILDKLPPDRTVMADVAMIKGRKKYQRILEELRTQHGAYGADIGSAFRERVPVKHLTARDFFHPNDYGYSYWYDAFAPAVRELIVKRHLAK